MPFRELYPTVTKILVFGTGDTAPPDLAGGADIPLNL